MLRKQRRDGEGTDVRFCGENSSFSPGGELVDGVGVRWNGGGVGSTGYLSNATNKKQERV